MTLVAPRIVNDISCKTFQYGVSLCSTGVVYFVVRSSIHCSTEKYFVVRSSTL